MHNKLNVCLFIVISIYFLCELRLDFDDIFWAAVKETSTIIRRALIERVAPQEYQKFCGGKRGRS